MRQSRQALCAAVTTLFLSAAYIDVASGQSRTSVHQTTLEEPNQKTPEVSTEELIKILDSKSDAVLDVRAAKEFAIAHIPGSINIYEKELERVVQLFQTNRVEWSFTAMVRIAARASGFRNNS